MSSTEATPPTPTHKHTPEDPYLWLEEVESTQSLAFAKDANAQCLAALGDPTASASSSTNATHSGTYAKVLAILESNDRIPHVSQYGTDDQGRAILVNFWKDSTNPKGLWRKTDLESYCSSSSSSETVPWETILDLDELAKVDDVSWVWKGSSSLPRSLDDASLTKGKSITRALLSLSRGGADATVTKEFDLLTQSFVTEQEEGFVLPEAKTRASYISRNVLYVGSDFGEGSLTDSGYPRVIKEWVRGTSIEDAPVVFEGEATDVSVNAYINDQRLRNGPIYDVRSRSMTFYTSKMWIRRLESYHVLAPEDPERVGKPEPEEFIRVDVQSDASVSTVANLLFISLRSDWEPVESSGTVYKSGSVLYVNAHDFLTQGKESCTYHILFEPTERTASEGFTLTKNYLILFTMDTVKSKMTFYKLNEEGTSLTFVGGDSEAKIRANHARAVDSYESDEFWFTTSGYTQPSTLSLANASQVVVGSIDDEFVVKENLKSLPEMYNADGLTVTQKFATSKDGTEIPYFIVAKKDIVLDGNTPTLLYGYGGFEISLGPKYIATVGAAWLERGGAYVEANIRGGGEFGPSWHQAGLKANRNKCFEDFIAIGEDLISNKICKPSTLAARGGSNGGLLMGMMYTLRPDLWGAIHCAVPLLDMQRFHTLLAGASWMAEYGDPDTSDWDNFLHKYSPYHLIDDNVEKYPPLLVTTSTRDDRVHPGHARKMVKKLWDISATNGKDWPVHYYENIEGGHGGAADAKQSAFMTALAYDFMWNTLVQGKSERMNE